MNYYNEFDPFAAEWLRQLIKAGHIADGIVDERSILAVSPNDIKEFKQCHFFAGIGVWSYALRQSGWEDNRPVWTGSCPCQPFSAAGSRAGFADERHLWPAFHYLIEQCRPGVVFGEQVASKDGRTWLDHVQTDLENLGFTVGAVDTCAAGVGAPHIRQRLFFVGDRFADAMPAGWPEGRPGSGQRSPAGSGRDGELADAKHTRRQRRVSGRQDQKRQDINRHIGRNSSINWLENADSERLERIGLQLQPGQQGQHLPETSGRGENKRLAKTQSEQVGNAGQPRQCADDRSESTGPTNGFWRDADWLYCRDDKWRPVEPGAFPLAHGAANRVGRLRGYGNAINAEVAQAFIESYLEI